MVKLITILNMTKLPPEFNFKQSENAKRSSSNDVNNYLFPFQLSK